MATELYVVHGRITRRAEDCMHSSTFSALTIQFKLYAAYLFTAVLSFAASSCLQSFMGAPHTTTRAWDSKKRKWNGNGMETEWKQNGTEMEEMRGKREWLNWITIMPINMHSRVSEHWKDSVVPSAPPSSSLPEPSPCKRRGRTQ